MFGDQQPRETRPRRIGAEDWTMLTIFGRWYYGTDEHNIVLVEHDGGKCSVYLAVNGSCQDARGVQRFTGRAEAVRAALDMCRDHGVAEAV